MELNRMIDHTILKPEATEAAVQKLLTKLRSTTFLCMYQSLLGRFASEQLADTDVAVCTVIGFPLGRIHQKLKHTKQLMRLKMVRMKWIW